MEFKTTEALNQEAMKYQNATSEELVQVFLDNHIYLPDYVHRFILQNIIKKYLFDEVKMSTYSDEFQFRLRSYNFFSIHLLEKTVSDYSLEVPSSEYKSLFMRFFFKNQKKFKKTVAFDKALDKLEGKKNGIKEDFKTCVENFHQLFYTPKGYLDGLELSVLKQSIVETYNLTNLKEFGAKYNVNVPRRINKQQLLDILVARFKLTDDEKQILEPKSILELSQYAKEKGFKISTDLKKADMVEFIIFTLNKYHEDIEKDLYNYDVLEEIEQEEIPEQVELDESQESVPTSNVYVEPEVKEVEPEPVQEVEPVKEAEPIQEEPTQEVEPVHNPEPVQEEPKEEPVPIERPEVYYDESVDNEIRDIIKKYYAKKARKDKGARWLIIALFIVLACAVAFFALKYYGILK